MQKNTFETAKEGEMSPVRDDSPMMTTVHEQLTSESLIKSTQKSAGKFELTQNAIITREEPPFIHGGE